MFTFSANKNNLVATTTNPIRTVIFSSLFLASSLAFWTQATAQSYAESNDDSAPVSHEHSQATMLALTLDSQSTVPPANAPGASGTGTISVDTNTGAISGSVTVTGTTGRPTVAHLHRGGVGEAGPVVIGLESNSDGSVWSFAQGATLDAVGIQDFTDGNLYINVHTEANAPGELRVQLARSAQLLNDGNSAPVTLTLTLDSQTTVPPADAPNASGTGNVTVDTNTGMISGSVTVTGTTGQPTAAHVHRGGAGEAGPIVFNMDGNADGSVWTIAEGSTLDAAGMQDFLDGNLYINVHTEANAPGELRAQLVSNTLVSLTLSLDPESTVPPANAPGASGTGSVSVDTATGAISGSVSVSGTTGQPTVAHVHEGGVGEAGPVVITMTSNADGSMWTIPEGTTLNAEELQSFINGNLYINVHTEANAPGELRAQLIENAPTTLSLTLDSQSTVPPANAPGASGTGSVTVNTNTGAMSGSVTVSGTTGTPTAAHVHRGGVGEAGPIVFNMIANDDASVWTIEEGATLDAAGIQDFLDGNLYINVHTVANMPGELRAQLVQGNANALGLRGEVYSSSALELFWNRQPAPVVAYRVDQAGSESVVVNGTSFFVQGLASNSTIRFTVTALDADNNTFNTESIDLTTNNDGIAAVAVENLRGEVYSTSAIELFWDVAGPAIGSTFAIFRDGVMVGTTDGRSFFEESLDSATTYTYVIEPQSGGVSATIMLTTRDGIANLSTGLGVDGQVYSSSAVEVFWQRVDAAVLYRIERDGALIDERDALSFFDSGLAAETGFNYQISALSSTGDVLATESIELVTTRD